MMKLEVNPTIHPTAKITQSELGRYTEIGKDCVIQETSLGDYSYLAGGNQVIYAEIGKFVSIATGVRINPGNHPTYLRIAQHHFTYRPAQYGFASTNDDEFFDWRRDKLVKIGNDVWIGHNAVIIPGVKVGNGAVIGSGAIATKDVAPYTIVAGNPAKLIRQRFDEATICQIESSEWWNWSHEKLRECLEDFSDIPLFLEKHGRG